jgi:D-aminoacyl-tRNA deacylase
LYIEFDLFKIMKLGIFLKDSNLKVLIQRVNYGSVTVGNDIIGAVKKGYVLFVGIARDDTDKDIDYLVKKILNLRVFSDCNGKFNESALDIKAEFLIISQFTLFADTRKGNRPSFTEAANPEKAELLFNRFVNAMQSSDLKVDTGVFQKHMIVQIENDGPVTIILDSRNKIKPAL